MQWLLGGDIAPPIALTERPLWCTLGAKYCSEIWLSDTWRKTWAPTGQETQKRVAFPQARES